MLLDDCGGDGADFSERNRAITAFLRCRLPQITEGTGHRLERFKGGMFGIKQCTGADFLAMLQLMEVVLNCTVDLGGVDGCVCVSKGLGVIFPNREGDNSWIIRNLIGTTSTLLRAIYNGDSHWTDASLKELDKHVENYFVRLNTETLAAINEAIQSSNAANQERARKRNIAAARNNGKVSRPFLKKKVTAGGIQKIQQLLSITHHIKTHGDLKATSAGITEKQHLKLFAADKKTVKASFLCYLFGMSCFKCM